MSEPKKNNMELWNAVCVTDPDVTKEVKAGRKITAICAQSQIKRATELWGSIGNGWGVKDEKYGMLDNEMHNNFCVYTALLFYPDGSIPIHADIEIIFSSGKWKGRFNDDFTKKIATDALTKGLSLLGFNADIFEGKFDDNKYVAELKAQKMADNKKSIPPERTARQKIVDEIVAILKHDKFADVQRAQGKAQIQTAKSNMALEVIRSTWLSRLNKLNDNFVDDIPRNGELTEEQEKKIDEAAGTLFPKEEQEAKELADRKALEEPDIF